MKKPKDDGEANNIIRPMEEFAANLGITGSLEKGASEEDLAQFLRERLEPLRCHKNQFLRYKDGVWVYTDASQLEATALAVIHPSERKVNLAIKVFNHMTMTLNGEPQPEYYSACKFDPSGRVLVNCANGVLAVEPTKVELVPHSEKFNFRGKLAAGWDPKAEALLFEAAVQRAIPDPEDLCLFRLMAGYLLYPSCRYEVCLILYGDTQTGKSKLAEAIARTIGRELTCTLSLHQMCSDKHKYALPELEHKVLNLSTEVDAAEIESSDMFKAMISGEPRLVERKNRDPFMMTPLCKHWFLTNHPPYFRHATEAEIRRVRMIHCPNKVTEVDPQFADKLANEAPGILVFMVDGLRQLLSGVKVIPQGGRRSRAKAEENAERLDPIKAFFEECCELARGNYETKDAVYAAFSAWCDDHDVKVMHRDWFFRLLRSRFNLKLVRPGNSGERPRCLAGLRLKSVWEVDD